MGYYFNVVKCSTELAVNSFPGWHLENNIVRNY